MVRQPYLIRPYQGLYVAAKGPMQARFESWQGPARARPLAALCLERSCAWISRRGRRVVVTHRGALGWEWTAEVATPADGGMGTDHRVGYGAQP